MDINTADNKGGKKIQYLQKLGGRNCFYAAKSTHFVWKVIKRNKFLQYILNDRRDQWCFTTTKVLVVI